MTSKDRPIALLSMDAGEVPGDLLPRLEANVTPVWSPAGVFDDDQAGIAEILVTANADIDAVYLKRLPALRAVITTGTAYDYVDTEYCRTHGVKVCNTPGYTGSSVAEHAFALLLAAARNIVFYDAVSRGAPSDSQPIAWELAARTVGIVGLGDIGSRIARIAQGFDMNVVFANRSKKQFDGAEQVDLDALLRRADAVFLTLPLTPETDGLLSADRLAVMKPTAILVNVSSDELVDVAALGASLEAGRLGGAGVDVIGSTQPYRDLPRAVLTPCIAWYTAESVHRRAATWIDTISAVMAGGDRHRVA